MTSGHEHTVDAARRAADRDELNEWVRRFLASPGSDNAPLAHELTDPPRWWLGPVELPLDQLHRLAGPSDQPVLVATDDHEWRDDVARMQERVQEGWDPPPVIVSHRDGQLVLEDGNHRVESLRRAGERLAWALVGFDDPEEREQFVPPTVTGIPSD